MRSLLIAAAAVVAFAGQAGASPSCTDAPRDQWIPLEQVKTTLESQGYTEIRSIEPEDGCWEAYAFNADHKRAEVYVDPVSGDIVEAKVDD